MEVRKFTSFKQIKEIFRMRMKNDFPPNELTPLFVLEKMWANDEYEGYGLYEDKALLGYALFIRVPAGEQFLYLLDYFAIEQSRRGSGFGSFFLKELADCIQGASCIVGEVEDPDKALDEPTRLVREKRARFYLRAGHYLTSVTATVNGADYRILEISTGNPHTDEQIKDLYILIYEHIAPKWFLKNHFSCELA